MAAAWREGIDEVEKQVRKEKSDELLNSGCISWNCLLRVPSLKQVKPIHTHPERRREIFLPAASLSQIAAMARHKPGWSWGSGTLT